MRVLAWCLSDSLSKVLHDTFFFAPNSNLAPFCHRLLISRLIGRLRFVESQSGLSCKMSSLPAPERVRIFRQFFPFFPDSNPLTGIFRRRNLRQGLVRQLGPGRSGVVSGKRPKNRFVYRTFDCDRMKDVPEWNFLRSGSCRRSNGCSLFRLVLAFSVVSMA